MPEKTVFGLFEKPEKETAEDAAELDIFDKLKRRFKGWKTELKMIHEIRFKEQKRQKREIEKRRAEIEKMKRKMREEHEGGGEGEQKSPWSKVTGFFTPRGGEDGGGKGGGRTGGGDGGGRVKGGGFSGKIDGNAGGRRDQGRDQGAGQRPMGKDSDDND